MGVWSREPVCVQIIGRKIGREGGCVSIFQQFHEDLLKPFPENSGLISVGWSAASLLIGGGRLWLPSTVDLVARAPWSASRVPAIFLPGDQGEKGAGIGEGALGRCPISTAKRLLVGDLGGAGGCGGPIRGTPDACGLGRVELVPSALCFFGEVQPRTTRNIRKTLRETGGGKAWI